MAPHPSPLRGAGGGASHTGRYRGRSGFDCGLRYTQPSAQHRRDWFRQAQPTSQKLRDNEKELSSAPFSGSRHGNG